MSRGKIGEIAVDAEKFKELVAAGRSAKEIAVEIGVSRQWVYQLADKHGVRLRRPPPYRRFGPQRPAKHISRVITGGIEHPINTTTSGAICELLVAADLMARGWRVFAPLSGHVGCHDLIAVKGEVVRTFEVRAANRRETGSLIFTRDRCMRSDHYAIVPRGAPVEYEPTLPVDVPPARSPCARPEIVVG